MSLLNSLTLLCYTLLTSNLTDGTFRCGVVVNLRFWAATASVRGRFLPENANFCEAGFKYFIHAVFQLHLTLTQ